MQNNTEGKVAWWVRLLAIVLLCVQLFAAYHIAASLISQQASLSSLFATEPLETLLLVFLNVLFAFVALTGRSPDKLFPIASLNLRQLLHRSH